MAETVIEQEHEVMNCLKYSRALARIAEDESLIIILDKLDRQMISAQILDHEKLECLLFRHKPPSYSKNAMTKANASILVGKPRIKRLKQIS